MRGPRGARRGGRVPLPDPSACPSAGPRAREAGRGAGPRDEQGAGRGRGCTCSRGPGGGRCPELREPGAWEASSPGGRVRDGTGGPGGGMAYAWGAHAGTGWDVGGARGGGMGVPELKCVPRGWLAGWKAFPVPPLRPPGL